MAWTVSRVAKLAGVSVRTLHHYDELGLVKPSGRSDGGYRLYAKGDFARLEQVLFFRELGFALDQIAKLLDAPSFDRKGALLMQRRLLIERAARTEALVGAVNRALDALEKGRTMPKEEMFEVLGSEPDTHAAEAEQRWGGTESFREAARRTKKYTKTDWLRIRTEAETIERELALLASTGHEPGDPEVVAVAEKHRMHLDRTYYPCPHEMHRALGEMYVADPRFAEHYERVRPGLAQFLRDAIIANAARPFVVGETKEAEKQQQFVRRGK
jgi:DNA-binding transcriptional MerR regulator